MSPPNQGFKSSKSLAATDASGALALISACGASRGGGIQLSGTWVGTVQFEQTLDNGTTWIAKTVYPALAGAGVTSATANGQWKFACGGETHVRARCSAFTSGTIVVDATFTAGMDAAVVGAGTAGVLSGPVQSVQGFAYGAALTLTRTADTVSYTAGDVIGINNAGSAGAAALTFANMGPAAGGEVLLTSSALRVDLAAVTSGMTSFRLHLYNVTPPSALLDNVAWDLPSGDRAAYLGFIDMGTPVDLGSTLYVEANQLNKQVTLLSSSLFGYLVTNGAYAPTSGEVYRPQLHSAGF